MLKQLTFALVFCAAILFAGPSMAQNANAFDTPEARLVELLDTIANGLTMEVISAIQEASSCRDKALAGKYKLGSVMADAIINKRDPRVKEAAADAFGRLYQTETINDKEPFEKVVKVVTNKEEDLVLRKACAEALVSIFKLDQYNGNKLIHRTIVDTMKDLLGNSKTDDNLKAVALSVAVQINSPEAIKAVREGVRSSNAEYRTLVLKAAGVLMRGDKDRSFPAMDFLLELAANLDASKADAEELVLSLGLVASLNRKYKTDITHIAAKIVKLIKDFSTPEKSSPEVILGCGRALLDHKSKFAETTAALLAIFETLPNDNNMRHMVVAILNDYMCVAESLNAEATRNIVTALLNVLRVDKDNKTREGAIFALGITPKFVARDEILDEFLKIMKDEGDENLWKTCKSSYERMTGRSVKIDQKTEQAKKIETIDTERKWLESNVKKFRPAA